VAAVVLHENRVVLVRRPGDADAGLISAPARKDLERTIVQEVQALLGVRAEVERTVGVFPLEDEPGAVVAYAVRAFGPLHPSRAVAEILLVHPERVATL
jgi:hypothetical protein